MGSLEKIDDNNFVIKFKKDDILNKCSGEFKHMDYTWKFQHTNYPTTNRASFFLCCKSPYNGLWNMNASVTINFYKSDQSIRLSYYADYCFKHGSLTFVKTFNTSPDNSVMYEATDIEIRVRINSVTGIQRKAVAEFDKEGDQLSDVALIVEGKKLHANKTVLATFSPVFRAMFFSGFKESTDKEVVINDVKYEDFKQFLQVILSSHPDINKKNVRSILVLADRYDVALVLERCEKFLLTVAGMTLTEKLYLAETYTLPKLHESCIASLDTKEKTRSICDDMNQFGPMTNKALIKKLLSYP